MIHFLVKTFIKDYENVTAPAVRERYGTLTGCVGIFLNTLLSASKFVGGFLTGSIAITADAFNNLSDAFSSLVTLVGFRMAGQKADDDHPFGHGRIEYLSGLIVSLSILLVGLELGKSSIGKILHPAPVSFSLFSVIILLVAIAVKLWMYYFNRRLSQTISSSAMNATALDSLSDTVATSAVLLGTLVGHFFSLPIDGWVGVVVALFILKNGFDAAKDTLNPLLGQPTDPATVHAIEETVVAHPEVLGIHDLIVHDYGPGRSMVSLHAEVPVDCDVLATHDVIDNIERELREKFRYAEVVIHMDPIATHDEKINDMHRRVSSLVAAIDRDMTIHDFRMTCGPHHTNLIFDVVVPHRFRLSDDQVKEAITQAVHALDATYFTVIEVDHAYVEK